MAKTIPVKNGKISKTKVKKSSKDIAKGLKNGKNGVKHKKPKSGSSVVHIPPAPSSVKQPTFSDSYIVKFLKDYK